MAYPEGVDLSKYDAVDYAWPEFVIVRLGSIIEDDWRRVQHVTYARSHGMTNLGSYWFLYNSDTTTPEAQAEHTYQLMVDLDLHEAPHFADAEGTCTTETAKRYIARMRQLRGTCGIYSGYWVKSRGGPTLGADYGWLAEYHDTYTLPAGWSEDFTKLWQWTSSSGTLDRDRFLGTTDEMHDFFGGDMAAVDEMLQGMADAETAAINAGMKDPGVPPDAQTVYYKRGWNRVRFNVNRIYAALASRLSADEQVISGQAAAIGDAQAGVATERARNDAQDGAISALASKTHEHGSNSIVAGPTT